MIDKAEADLRLPTAGVEDAAWRELKSLLGHRIAEGVAGAVSTKSIDTIVDEELGSGPNNPIPKVGWM